MRITSLRVDLAYYARRELADEPAAPRELVGQGWSTVGEPARRSALELDLPRAPRAQVRAVDVTVHAPKDVSILWGLASEPRARAIAEAHRRAVLGTLRWLERLDLAPRDRLVPVSGLLGVAAHHRLSRAKDPHLHSHIVLANALVADDGVHTLAVERLRRVAPALELLYRVELRRGLAEVGVVLEGRGLGRWGVAGMPEGLADAFSHRRKEVLARVGQHAGWRARELAALATRRHWGVEPAALEALQSQWRARLRGVVLRPVAPGPEQRRPERVADPAFDEVAWWAERLEAPAGQDAVVEAALRGLLGPVQARGLLAGVPLVADAGRLHLDGTFARTYAGLAVERRLELAGLGQPARVLAVRGRDAVQLADDLHAGLGREHLVLLGRSQREAALLAAVGGFRPGRRSPRVVLDAHLRAPSELRELGPDVVLVQPVRGTAESGVSPCLVLEEEGRRIEIHASLEPALARAVELAVAELGRSDGSGVLVAVENDLVRTRVRRALARKLGVEDRLAFVGERVRLPGGELGRLIGDAGHSALVTVGEGTLLVARERLEPAGIVLGEEAPVALGRRALGLAAHQLVVAPGLRSIAERARDLGVSLEELQDACTLRARTPACSREVLGELRRRQALLVRSVVEPLDRARERSGLELDRGLERVRDPWLDR